jgi:anti-sigma-K factor RskA
VECTLIQPELVLYHFGTIAPGSRVEVERHLLGCRTCLAGYLALKRHLESEPEAGPRPSENARVKLRAAVEREFARPRPLSVAWRRTASWGLAAAAAAVIAAVAFQGATPVRSHAPVDPNGIPVDSANPGDAGLTVL